MSVAIIAIGIPGSGKTSVLKPFAEAQGFVYINRDDIRQELLGNPADRSRNALVWEKGNALAADALARDIPVVLDATFAEGWKRRDMIRFLRNHGATRVIGVYATIPVDVAKERNQQRNRTVPEQVIDWMLGRLTEEPPSLSDGFDILIPLEEYEKLPGLLTI